MASVSKSAPSLPATATHPQEASPGPGHGAAVENPPIDVRPSVLGLPRFMQRAWAQRTGATTAISIGGFLGANARYHMSLWAAKQWGEAFPWGTLLINVIGSFVLGFYLTLVTERFIGRPTTRLFLATGFLGAFTTFSTFSYEVVRLLEGGAAVAALAYATGSLVLGLAAGVVGVLCAHAL